MAEQFGELVNFLVLGTWLLCLDLAPGSVKLIETGMNEAWSTDLQTEIELGR